MSERRALSPPKATDSPPVGKGDARTPREPRTPARRPGRPWLTAALLLGIALIVVASLLLAPDPGEGEEAFGGTDAAVTRMLEEQGAEPWFRPLFSPGSAEVESGLFALQAALGAGLCGYAVGRLHERRRRG